MFKSPFLDYIRSNISSNLHTPHLFITSIRTLFTPLSETYKPTIHIHPCGHITCTRTFHSLLHLGRQVQSRDQLPAPFDSVSLSLPRRRYYIRPGDQLAHIYLSTYLEETRFCFGKRRARDSLSRELYIACVCVRIEGGRSIDFSLPFSRGEREKVSFIMPGSRLCIDSMRSVREYIYARAYRGWILCCVYIVCAPYIYTFLIRSLFHSAVFVIAFRVFATLSLYPSGIVRSRELYFCFFFFGFPHI